MQKDPGKLTSTKAIAIAALGIGLAACGGEPEANLSSLSGDLDALELALRSGDTARKNEACLEYASICEHAAGICLRADNDRFVRRCEDVMFRCETKLTNSCDRPGPETQLDAGVDVTPLGDAAVDGVADGAVDAQLSRYDASQPDGRRGDGRPDRSDAGWPDAWQPDAGRPDVWIGDAAILDCAPLDARGAGTCRMLLGASWNGGFCQEVFGCRCEGRDCRRLYRNLEQCRTAHAPCHSGACYVGGCSGQLCTDHPDAISTCEWEPKYDCYRSARCQRQRDGRCGWTPSPNLQLCLGDGPDDCRVTGCDEHTKCQPCGRSYTCLPFGELC